MFDALVDEVTRRIEATEGRERSRRQTDQRCFEHSVKEFFSALQTKALHI